MRIDPQALEAWLAGRPEIVKQTARRYPPGTAFRIHGKVMYIVSIYEDGGLGVTLTNPFEDYDKAVAERTFLCDCCVGKLDALRIEEE